MMRGRYHGGKEFDSILGIKATVVASVAVSIGGIVGLSLLLTGGLMKDSIKGVWCGAALLWRLGGESSPIREFSAQSCCRSIPMSSAGGSIPPLHTFFRAAVS